jgi:hypothetical protein
MLMDFGRTCGLRAGRKDKGRPMVWETREVRKEVSHSWFASPYLPSLLITNIENTLGHAASTSLACKNKPERYHSRLLHLPRTQKRAGGGFMLYFDAVRIFYLPRMQERAVHHHHLPRTQKRAGGGFMLYFMPFACLPPPSHATARRRWIFVTLSEPSLTSQGRTRLCQSTLALPLRGRLVSFGAIPARGFVCPRVS